ncbi:MAG: CPBP family glutamic-type intramembrane protease [Planctomycetota bacterium]
MNEQSVGSTPPRRLHLALLIACCLLPAAQTLITVHWEWYTPITHPALKALMVIIPLLVWRWSRRGRKELLKHIGWQRTSFLPGLLSGAALSAIVLAAYYTVLPTMIDFRPVAEELAGKLNSLGLRDYYWLMAAVVSLFNAFLEEYYWRAFLLGEVFDRIGRGLLACLLCGGLFGLHHILALSSINDPGLIALGAGATAIAATLWGWLRARGGSILDCYLSHLMVDLAVFWVGYDMISSVA